MPSFRFLLRVSRPRFWFYIFGPYIIGLIAGSATRGDLLSSTTALFAVYFLLPANLLIYGINDIFDYETDRLNEKKVEYEILVPLEYQRSLAILIGIINVPFLIAAIALAPSTLPSVAAFLFFSIFYSAPPIRAKTKPFLDAAFNVLYICPGVFGYQLLTNSYPPLQLLIAAGLWTAAMHAYSAIPDIEADGRADLHTVATFCGQYGTLALCGCLYALAAILSFEYVGPASVSLGLAYIILMAASVRSLKTGRLFKLYRAFPLINVAAGFILFWNLALTKLI